jgi:hypothetical protein
MKSRKFRKSGRERSDRRVSDRGCGEKQGITHERWQNNLLTFLSLGDTANGVEAICHADEK